jgi:hypothetical protein
MDLSAVDRWFNNYDGPKFELEIKPGKFECCYGWNETLVGFGTHGREVRGYGDTPVTARIDAYRQFEEAHGRIVA